MIELELLYKEFSQCDIGTKITKIEDFFEYVNFSEQNEKVMRSFFRDIIENETDKYLRKISLETLCVLTSIDKIRMSAALEIMLDIDNDDDPFLLITVLRYFSLFYEGSNEILQKIESNKYSFHEEVASEAYFRHGLIEFYQVKVTNEFEFLKHLNSCKSLFASSMTIENRIDAEFYISIIDFIERIFNPAQEEQTTLYFNRVSENLWKYSIGFMNECDDAFEHQIYKSINALKNITISINRNEVWSDFLKEFIKLAEYNYDFQSQELQSNKIYRRYISSFKEQLNEHFLKPVYYRSLKYHKLRIKNMINEYEGIGELVEFLQVVYELIDTGDKNKKKDEIDIVKYTLLLKDFIPETEVVNFMAELKTNGDSSNLENFLGILSSIGRKNNMLSDYKVITGYPQGNEIFLRIVKEIKKSIPFYETGKMQFFQLILEEIIRYLILSIHGKKDNYLFLYNAKNGGLGNSAVEQHIQDSLHEHLLRSNIAYAVTEESKNFADGGRVDIVLKLDSVSFPIELKKTSKPISNKSIQEKYLEQVLTYTYSYDQLGIFVLLDLNEKKAPVNDIRELVYLDYLKPLYDLEDKYPDYVIVCIIPGNKPLPSQKSSYN